ncbi:MAG: hypothetical protein IT162_12780 [Bryobacterales bacterium]|nr:hypothetical protein [Bryobacterales bacterium]
MFTRRALLAAAAMASPTVSAVDRDGMPLIDGRRTFLHGLYQLPQVASGGALRAAADAGFQVVHGDPTRASLDAAAAVGLKRWVTTSAAPERIRSLVAELAAHRALLFWETEDEPSYQWKKPGARVSPAKIKDAYALLKKLDAGRAVYLNHSPTNLVSTLQQYNPGGDFLATDIYPVIPPGIRTQYALWPDGRQGDLLNNRVSQVGQYMDKLRQVAGPGRACFMVLQAFAWENLREKDRDAKMVLYPTREELRFMAFHAIVRGANGLLWWGLKFTPAEAPLWADLAAVTRELRGLDAALAAPAVAAPGRAARLEYHDTGHSLDRGVEWVLKPGPVLLAVNADPNPVDVTFHGLLPGDARRQQLAPFGVAVLR